MGDFSLPGAYRLTRTNDYRTLYRTGRKVPSAGFLLFYAASPSGTSRIGLSSGKKVGNAVVRNKVKRRMREILRLNRPRFAFPADVVLIAQPRAARLAYSDMEREIVRLLKTARLLS